MEWSVLPSEWSVLPSEWSVLPSEQTGHSHRAATSSSVEENVKCSVKKGEQRKKKKGSGRTRARTLNAGYSPASSHHRQVFAEVFR